VAAAGHKPLFLRSIATRCAGSNATDEWWCERVDESSADISRRAQVTASGAAECATMPLDLSTSPSSVSLSSTTGRVEVRGACAHVAKE
jgi:hypothetical protein